MRLKRKGLKLLALFLGLSLVAAACGSDDGSRGAATTTGRHRDAEGAAGGDFVDLGTFVGDPPEHIDPALNSTLDAYQVDQRAVRRPHRHRRHRPGQPGDRAARRRVVRGQRRRHPCGRSRSATARRSPTARRSCPARSRRRGSGPPTSPATTATCSTSSRVATRRSTASADTIAGVVADDDAMTLTVTLSAPYSNFPAVAGFQLFLPVPEEADRGRRRAGRTA